jgi:hypothetical protein
MKKLARSRITRSGRLGNVPPGPPPPAADYLLDPYYAPVVAFEGAMGYGANATGGRGNGTNGDTQLIFVDNLNDSGPGSLRAALNTTGKRVIIPRVGGYVPLASELKTLSTQGNFTFLGQLAPGGGLGLRYGTLPAFKMSCWTHGSPNVIVRYLSIRAGEVRGDSTCAYLNNTCYNAGKPLRIGAGCSDSIFDHISAAFGTDGNIDFSTSDERVTVQNSIMTHPLANAGHYEGDHAFNQLVTKVGRLSLLYNLYANARERSADIGCKPLVQFIGNTIHNVRYATVIYTTSSSENSFETVASVDFRRNTFIHGPMTHATEKDLRFRNNSPIPGLYCPTYLEGNVSPFITDYATLAGQKAMARRLSPSSTSDSITLDDWVQTSPIGTPDVLMLSAAEAFDYVMANAGNNRVRDSLDTLVINHAQSIGTPISTRPTDVAEAGGFPSIASGTYPTANADGIPTAWRTATSEAREWYELDTGGTGRMIIENYAADVAMVRW